jgi:hypothetical protein
MTVLANRTPHAVATTYARDTDGRLTLFVSVKATFKWDRTGRVEPVPPQPVVVKDEVVGEGLTAAMTRAAEVGPRKPNVDVLLAGALVMPEAMEEVEAMLRVGGEVDKVVRVLGPRSWVTGRLRDRVPSSPEPFTRAPIDWRCSFGGASLDDPDFYEARNPAGCGLSADLEQYEEMDVPLFEDPAAPITSWKSRPAPVGFGPVAPHWLPRAARAGTYDETWRQERAPLPATDLDPGFYNVAPEDQQLTAYEPGDEVRLRNMTVNQLDRFVLPPFDVPVTIATPDVLVEARAAVDTLVIEPEALLFSLVGRVACPLRRSAIVYEIVVGEPTRAHRRALETGKRHRPLGARGS